MIEQISNAITFAGFFTESKLGKAGLTVTVDVFRGATPVVTGGSASEIGGGLYAYTLASASVTTVNNYYAVFKTATTTVDQQHLPALWTVGVAGVESLDAAVSSRLASGGYSAPDNAGVAAIKLKTDLIPASPAAVGSAMTLAAGAITSATLAADAITSGALAASAVAEIQSGLFLAAGYTAPDNVGIAAIKLKTDLIPASPAAVGSAMTLAAGAITSATLAADAITSGSIAASAVAEIQSGLFLAAGYTAPDNVGIAAIKLKTDLIPASPAAVGSAMTLAAGAITSATLAADAITSGSIAASAVAEIQSGLFLAAGYTAPDNVGIAAIQTTSDRLATAIELDGATYRLTANALEQAPAGGGGALTAEQAGMLQAVHAKTQLITISGFTVLSPVSQQGGTITARCGDTWSIDLVALGSLAGVEEVWFSIKPRQGTPDGDALLFASLSAGAETLNGATAAAPGDVVITITDAAAGDVRVTVADDLTSQLTPLARGRWAIKTLKAGQTATRSSGVMILVGAEIGAIG